jgi:TM2 domain-containing membrane protein YozV
MRYFLYITTIFLWLSANAQNSVNTRFLEHLINKGDYREAVYLIDKEVQLESAMRTDSINYFKGWAHYALKELETSSIALLSVSESSPFYQKARFFAGYNYVFLSNYHKATSVFEGLGNGNLIYTNLKELQLSGIDILNGKYLQAEQRLALINNTLSPLHDPLNNLKLINHEMLNHKSKSPFIAALLSAVVPGAGKFYAGRKGQAVSSFISTVGFGLIAWENYRKLGPTHAKTIVFGTAFAANYAPSIYGSAMAVKVKENDYKNVMHQQVLFNLHIPLRNIFE